MALCSCMFYSYWTMGSASYGLPGIYLADDAATFVALTEEA